MLQPDRSRVDNHGGDSMADAGGTISRTDEVLAPAFAEGLPDLELDEVRRRRDRTLAERDYQSYLRRLVQVRQDILLAERDRRESGQAEEPLIRRLTSVLAQGPRARGRGEALRMTLSQEDLDAAERAIEDMSPSVDFASPETMSEETLADAIRELAEVERTVSTRRTAVLHVHDLFQDEVKRRYREDPSSIPTGL
jgi:hypothetical protein